MIERVLLGDEALAQAAVDAGLSCAYGYPGTPSTEVMEYLISASEANGFKAMWCTNEKTAYEEALFKRFRRRLCELGITLHQRRPGCLRCRRPGNAFVSKRAGYAGIGCFCKGSGF